MIKHKSCASYLPYNNNYVVSGVYLSLNGKIIINDSYVLFADIGTDASGLQCNTEKIDCCRGSDAADGVARGHWYRPDGTQVGTYTEEEADRSTMARNFFYRNRHAGVVHLNQLGNYDPPDLETGRFRCEVPNADGDFVTMYVNISVWFVYPITSSGTSFAGESYSLKCRVMTGSIIIDQPVITWLMGYMDNVITSGVMTNGSKSTLTFNPLSASHAGTYTCRATLGSVWTQHPGSSLCKVSDYYYY